MFNAIKFLLRLAITALWKKRYRVYLKAARGSYSFPINARSRSEAHALVRRIGFTDADILSIQES
jgi:hypothetical protein